MTDMIERVAEALMLLDRDKPRDFDWFGDGGYKKLMYGDPPIGWDRLCETSKVIFRQQALAAIKAMDCDPGHDVTAAVVEPMDDRTKAVRDWRAMIRACLPAKPTAKVIPLYPEIGDGRGMR